LSAARRHGLGASRRSTGERRIADRRIPERQSGELRIALYGGTFDPIHMGHLAVARAAARRFHLDEILFIPAGLPPHKHSALRTCYADRYAMVALGCAGQPRFLASLAESGADRSGREVFYSVDTVKRFQRSFHGTRARIYFLMGADSFLQIRTWKDYRTLLGLCDFIVASRPGFPLNALRRVIPPELLAPPGSAQASPDPRTIRLRRTTVYVLDSVASPISASAVRRRLHGGRSIHGLVPARVEEYITKQAIYR
jgi:nicotinate-nucleotide adenylyltransferase